MIGFDSATSTSGNSVTSLSWSHTCSGSDRALVVFVGGVVFNNFIGATYGGVIMTPVRITNRGLANPAIWLWVLVNPPSGTATVTVSSFTANPAIGASISFTGVDGKARYDGDGGTFGTSANPVATVAVGSGELVIAAMVDSGAQAVTPGQTQVVNVTTPSLSYGLSATYSTVASNTWTLGGSTNWATVGVSLKPVGASGNPPVPAKTIYEANISQYGPSNYSSLAAVYTDWVNLVCTNSGSGTVTSSGTTITFSTSQSGLAEHPICVSGQARRIVSGSATSWVTNSAFNPAISSPTAWTFGEQAAIFATNWDYYDGVEVYRKIGEYLGASSPWYDGSSKCQDIVVRGYYIANNGAVPGYQHFTRGLWLDYTRNGTANSKSTVLLLRDNAAYSGSGDASAWERSREAAYGINAHVMASRLGFAPDGTRRQTLIEWAYGHFDSWFVTKNSIGQVGDDIPAGAVGNYYLQPFMVAISARALIEDWEETHDTRLIAALTRALDFMWLNAWNAADQSFWYENWTTDVFANPVVWAGTTTGSRDLNLVIAPVYAWLGWQLRNSSYIDRADLLFQGGVVGAFLDNGKQFNQNYTYSFDYLTWRVDYFAAGIPATVRAFSS